MIVTSRKPIDETAGAADVYVMQTDGTSLTNVTASPDHDSDPDWGPA